MKSPGLLDIAGAKNMMSQIRAFTLYPALSDSSLIGWVYGATTINPTYAPSYPFWADQA